MKRIIIVGAGIAGLSYAYECLLRKFNVLIVESAPSIGGLSRSITHNGCQLDIGVHILHLRDEEVFQKIREIVDPDKWIRVKRKGKLYIKGNYVDWPLRYTAICQLPLGFGLKIFWDQLFKKKTGNGSTSNFQDELLAIYGPTLYYSFFHPLTKKFFRTDPEKIHSDWAFSSLRSATKIEDKSFSESYKYLTKTTDSQSKKEFSIIKFLLQSLKANRNKEPFYYFKDGFGTLPEAYKEKILQLGGKIKTNSSVDAFILEQNKVKQCIINGNTYDLDYIVWTGNLYDLCGLLDIEYPQLQHLHSKFVYFFLKNCNKDHQVCYYADAGVSFTRGTILSNHSKTIINNYKISDLLCLEYTFKSKDEMFGNFETIKNMAIEDLRKVEIINDRSSIDSIFELNVPYSYPVLTINYKKELTKFQNQISKFDNILTFGRQATFNYENVDIVIKEAINHPMFKF